MYLEPPYYTPIPLLLTYMWCASGKNCLPWCLIVYEVLLLPDQFLYWLAWPDKKKNWLDSPNLLQGALWKTLTLELLFAIFDSAASSWHAFPQRRLQGSLPLHHQTLPSHMTEYYVCVRFWSGQIPFTIWIGYLVTALFQECRRVLVSFQMRWKPLNMEHGCSEKKWRYW